jgi:hypothetical protein
MTGRRSSSGSYTQSPSKVKGVTTSAGGMPLPPPPNMTPTPQKQFQSNYAQNLARSMTIEEMRELHRRALNEAEAKQTELRLVLASRYRELVGSSDEVTKMRKRAQELHELVHALPNLMEKLVQSTDEPHPESKTEENGDSAAAETTRRDHETVSSLRSSLVSLPRLVHRALDTGDVHEATASLLKLFNLIAERTDEYPLATALSPGVGGQVAKVTDKSSEDPLLQAQIRMTFLHVQTLPSRINRIATTIIGSAGSFGPNDDPMFGAQRSAAALSTLDLLDINQERDRAVSLLDLYFDSKARLLQSLLGMLNTSDPGGEKNEKGADNAEEILSKIVLILQYDVILHPYQIFVMRRFPCIPGSASTGEGIMKSLPIFPPAIVQSKSSNFLSAHLPLIRTKVKSVLVDIAGTTASALGKIRQSLYDKTDGLECMERLDGNGVCTWEEAVNGVVDVKSVLSSTGGGHMAYAETSADSFASDRKFSLWSVLFSTTFSSLVHSLLTNSFHSVHTKVVSTLRLSLANAPPLSSMLPHEAYRNTLQIASELDIALLKVSDDAHELLVHAEERVESERRLRQSLYVQTCEIMGRLICELRRMLLLADNVESVKHFIVGRLCHLLKFRLSALPRLLDPNSSPAALQGASGMISFLELSSAFDLADDNDDGLITFQEAMEAVDSAFSGTQFHGAEMVRETLLLPTPGEKERFAATSGAKAKSVIPQDVTLNELTLLLARGLRHENSGMQSALGTIQNSLDRIISECFRNWAKEVLTPYSDELSSRVNDFLRVACTSSEDEYKRTYGQSDDPAGFEARDASPYLIGFLLNASFTLNRSVCPSDSLLPVPSPEYAAALGIQGIEIPKMMDVIRWALLSGAADAASRHLSLIQSPREGSGIAIEGCAPSGLAQLRNDVSFVQTCFFERNAHGFGEESSPLKSKEILDVLSSFLDDRLKLSGASNIAQSQNHKYVFEVCDLFLSSLIGEGSAASAPLGDFIDMGSISVPSSRTDANPLLHAPLASSCRFPLLPIQADRTLGGVHARGKYKEKDEPESRQDSVGTGAMRAGLGFFSSMLKKT